MDGWGRPFVRNKFKVFSEKISKPSLFYKLPAQLLSRFNTLSFNLLPDSLDSFPYIIIKNKTYTK